MTKVILISFFVLTATCGRAQTDTTKIFSDTTNQTIIEPDYNMWNPVHAFTLEAGAWIPIGNLATTFKTNPNFRLCFGFPVSNNYRVDLGTSVFIPVNAEKIDYIKPDTTLTGKAILSGVLGFWITKVNHLKGKYFYDIRLGTGLGFLQTNIPTGKPKEAIWKKAFSTR